VWGLARSSNGNISNAYSRSVGRLLPLSRFMSKKKFRIFTGIQYSRASGNSKISKCFHTMKKIIRRFASDDKVTKNTLIFPVTGDL
jgi:hypothetical protein